MNFHQRTLPVAAKNPSKSSFIAADFQLLSVGALVVVGLTISLVMAKLIPDTFVAMIP
jgi:hypothetical protein